MSTNNICFYKEGDKRTRGGNLKTTKLLDCAIIGVCAVIRSDTIFFPLFPSVNRAGSIMFGSHITCENRVWLKALLAGSDKVA